MNLERKRLIIIFLIALSLRLTLFLAVGPWQHKVLKERIIISDSYRYNKTAVNLLENNAFSISKSSPYVPDIEITPIYPFFLASLYAIFGYKTYIVILSQLIIGSITCLLIYKIGRTLFNEKIALLASLFLAFEYSSIFFSNMLMTETLFTFLFIVHIYFLVKFLMVDNNRGLIYSAIFLGLSTLCRPVSIYFFLFLLGTFYFHFKKNLRVGILKYSILTLVYLLTIAPWMIRNYIVSDKFIVSSMQENVLGWRLFSESSAPVPCSPFGDLRLCGISVPCRRCRAQLSAPAFPLWGSPIWREFNASFFEGEGAAVEKAEG